MLKLTKKYTKNIKYTRDSFISESVKNLFFTSSNNTYCKEKEAKSLMSNQENLNERYHSLRK